MSSGGKYRVSCGGGNLPLHETVIHKPRSASLRRGIKRGTLCEDVNIAQLNLEISPAGLIDKEDKNKRQHHARTHAYA